jgi:molecular chaperone IbpA
MYQLNSTNINTLIDETMRDLNRLAIGFEPTLRRLQVTQGHAGNQVGYPPFNLEKLSDTLYRITLAVAGFKMEDLDITVENNQLTITGDIRDKDDDDRIYIHKGIAGRGFNRTFILADYVTVVSAELENGLLVVDLQQEIPEALKPKKIAISNKNVIDAKIVSKTD